MVLLENSYILSGAVMEPSALDALLPQWRETYPDHPLSQSVTSSGRLLTEVPHPAPAADEQQGKLHREPKSRRCMARRSRSTRASPARKVRSVVTHDARLTRQCTKGPPFELGVTFRARATLLAEGAHGSLSKQAVAMYDLRHGKEVGLESRRCGVSRTASMFLAKYSTPSADRSPHTPTAAVESTTWPTASSASASLWVDYKNPYIEQPYRDFQRTKYHPHFRAILANGTRLAYGARALTKGGL
ncbi:hypothetical protein K438DRAFT_1783279 [Mycena galopus ATCC 62051]|nr:hypothetical protein K438DRAFT_1783279 [Mycena galopus ATCC 62051]